MASEEPSTISFASLAISTVADIGGDNTLGSNDGVLSQHEKDDVSYVIVDEAGHPMAAAASAALGDDPGRKTSSSHSFLDEFGSPVVDANTGIPLSVRSDFVVPGKGTGASYRTVMAALLDLVLDPSDDSKEVQTKSLATAEWRQDNETNALSIHVGFVNHPSADKAQDEILREDVLAEVKAEYNLRRFGMSLAQTSNAYTVRAQTVKDDKGNVSVVADKEAMSDHLTQMDAEIREEVTNRERELRKLRTRLEAVNLAREKLEVPQLDPVQLPDVRAVPVQG